MARKTTTVFTCDGCDSAVERRELRKFRIDEYTLAGRFQAGAEMELCTDCEKRLHGLLKDLMPADQYELIEGIVRP